MKHQLAINASNIEPERRVTVFLSCLIDKDTNKGAIDESKKKHNKIVIMTMTSPIYETHSLRAFMLKSNRQTKGNKEVMHIKTPICNALTVAHKCKGLLPIKANMTIKRK